MKERSESRTSKLKKNLFLGFKCRKYLYFKCKIIFAFVRYNIRVIDLATIIGNEEVMAVNIHCSFEKFD